jgi:hypothetical protein
MNSTFTCPHCGIVSNIDPAHVGKTGPCKGCGKEVTVPFPKEANLPPTASSRGSATPWIIGCAVIAVVGFVVLSLAVCGGLTFFSLRSSQQMQQELIRADQAERIAVEAQAEAQKLSEEAEKVASQLDKAAAELERKANEAPPPP